MARRHSDPTLIFMENSQTSFRNQPAPVLLTLISTFLSLRRVPAIIPQCLCRGGTKGRASIPTFFEDANLLLYSPMSQEDVRWNWEKILFDKNGQPFRRYSSMVEPFEIEEDIISLLAQ